VRKPPKRIKIKPLDKHCLFGITGDKRNEKKLNEMIAVSHLSEKRKEMIVFPH